MPPRQLARWAERARRRTGALLIVNDRPDVAEAAGADGVHVGETDLSVRQARRVLRADRIVGATTHTLQEARAARDADYLSVGPMFASRTKPELTPGGWRYYTAARRLGPPVFAIGGITPSNAGRFDRVAVCEAVAAAEDPARVVRALRRSLATRAPSASSWPGTSRK
jgi:thiamine-phosphate pyrophosphorylase